MEKYIVILVILATIYFIQNNLKTTEGFETTATQSVFGVDDLNAVNTLAQISRQLMTNGLTVPGNMTVSGAICTGTTLPQYKGTIVSNMGDSWGMLWGSNCALIGQSGKPIRFGHATDCNASGWAERVNITADGTLVANSNITAVGNIVAHNALDVNAGGGNVLKVDAGGIQAKRGMNVEGNRTYIKDEENKGRLRVGAAWGIPGIYSQDDGNDLVIGAVTGKVQVGNPGGSHTLCVNGTLKIGGTTINETQLQQLLGLLNGTTQINIIAPPTNWNDGHKYLAPRNDWLGYDGKKAALWSYTSAWKLRIHSTTP